MEPQHQPIVRIAGSIVPTGWEHAREALLDEITIDWGQETVYEEVPPAVLKLELLWPSGSTLKVHQLQDQPLEIELPELGRFLFRGLITSTKWEETYIWDEENQTNVRLWLVRLTAVDAVREIAGFIPLPRDCRGAAGTPSRDINLIMKSTQQWPFFGSSDSYERSSWVMPYSVREDIIAAGLIDAVPLRYKSLPTSPTGGFRTFTAETDAWQLLREVWGTYPLAEPCLEQDTKTIRLQEPSTVAAGARLLYTGGKLTLALTSTGNPATGVQGPVRLTGDQLTMADDPFTIGTDQTLNITRVEYETMVSARTDLYPTKVDANGNVISRYSAYHMSTEKRGADVSGGRGNARTYSRRLFMASFSERLFGELQDPVDANAGASSKQTINAHLAATSALIAKLNGVIPLPECVVELEDDRARLPVWVWPFFLSIDPHAYIANPVFVTGSPLTQELGLANAGQVIGGRLAYSSGWSHRLRFAPLQNEVTGSLRVDQIVTHATATYNHYADDVLFGDLGIITQGA